MAASQLFQALSPSKRPGFYHFRAFGAFAAQVPQQY